MNKYIYIKETGQVAGPLTMDKPAIKTRTNEDCANTHSAFRRWKDHIKSLPRIDIVGEHSFLDGQILEIGKDIQIDRWYGNRFRAAVQKDHIPDVRKKVQKEKDFEPGARNINEAFLASHSCTSGNDIEQEEVDKDVEERLFSMMRENSPKLFMYFLALKGREMVAINATDLTMSQHMTIEDKRYKVTCHSTIELPNSEQEPDECDANTLNQGTEPMANNNSFTEEDLLELIRYCAERYVQCRGNTFWEKDYGVITPKEILTNFLKQQKGA